MVNTLADNVDTMVDNQLIILPEQGQEMLQHTPWPQPPAHAPQQQTLQPRPWTGTPETHPLSGLEDLGLEMPQKPRPAVPSLREAEAARNTLVVDVHQKLLGDLAGGHSLPNVTLPDLALPEALPDGSVGE